MLRNALLTLTAFIALVGVMHIALTPATYDTFTLDALWFIGSGMALILLSLLHFVLFTADRKKLFFIIGLIGNGLGLVLVGLILSIVVASHIIFLFVLLLLQTLLFILFQQKSPSVERDEPYS